MLKNITNLITAANKNIETLAWEPSVAQGTHVTPAVYLHLVLFPEKLNFRYKSWPTKLRIYNQAKNTLPDNDRKKTETNRDYNFIYIYIDNR